MKTTCTLPNGLSKDYNWQLTIKKACLSSSISGTHGGPTSLPLGQLYDNTMTDWTVANECSDTTCEYTVLVKYDNGDGNFHSLPYWI